MKIPKYILLTGETEQLPRFLYLGALELGMF